jgi:alpha-1,6-mannosyltransferase
VVASVLSFVAVALVGSVPGSPLTPVLAAPPGGPFAWLADALGLESVHGTSLVALAVVAVTFAAGAFALVLRETWRGHLAARTALALAVGFHVALLFVPLLFSRDVYSYAYYGKIAATYHANPYVATPADFRSDVLAAFVGPKWFDTPAVYGPLWTQLSSGVVRLASSVEAQVAAFRVVAIAASLATVFVISRVARSRWAAREAFAIAAFGLNPVVLFQSAASGHNDVLVALAVAAALAFAFSERELGATASLALGTLVKVTAALPLALFVLARVVARPRGERAEAALKHLGLAAAIGVVAAIPFLNTRDPSLGLVELAGHEGWLAPSRFFRRFFDAISGDTLGVVPRIVFPLVLLAVVVVLGRELIRRAPASPWLEGASWGWALVALMLLGPVLLPWYVVWALPLAWLVPRVPRLVLLGTSVALTLSQWAAEPSRFPTAYDANLFFGHYVLTPVVIALLGWLLVDLVRRTRSGAALEEREEPEPAADRDR